MTNVDRTRCSRLTNTADMRTGFHNKWCRFGRGLRRAFGIALLTSCGSLPLYAQTDADLIVRTGSALGQLIAESGVHLPATRVHTGSGQKRLVLQSDLHGTSIYGDGNVGMLRFGLAPGKVALSPGFGGVASLESRRTSLYANVESATQASVEANATNGGSANVSSNASVSSLSVSTGGSSN